MFKHIMYWSYIIWNHFKVVKVQKRNFLMLGQKCPNLSRKFEIFHRDILSLKLSIFNVHYDGQIKFGGHRRFSKFPMVHIATTYVQYC